MADERDIVAKVRKALAKYSSANSHALRADAQESLGTDGPWLLLALVERCEQAEAKLNEPMQNWEPRAKLAEYELARLHVELDMIRSVMKADLELASNRVLRLELEAFTSRAVQNEMRERAEKAEQMVERSAYLDIELFGIAQALEGPDKKEYDLLKQRHAVKMLVVERDRLKTENERLINGQDLAGLCNGDAADVVQTLAVVRAAYGWILDIHGRVCGLVAGDMGYADTSIVIPMDNIRALDEAAHEQDIEAAFEAGFVNEHGYGTSQLKEALARFKASRTGVVGIDLASGPDKTVLVRITEDGKVEAVREKGGSA